MFAFSTLAFGPFFSWLVTDNSELITCMENIAESPKSRKAGPEKPFGGELGPSWVFH